MCRLIHVLIILGMLSSSLMAQQDLMMLNLPSVMQSSYVNPAIGSHSGIHIGLPFMSSVSAQHNNNFLNPDGLFLQVEDRLEIQSEEFIARLSNDNRTGFDFAVDVFSIGMPIKGNYFSFSIREKASFQLQLPKGLLSFPVTGNGQFDLNGGVIDLSDMSVSLDHYVEYGLGWQKSFNERLDVGLRAKVLFGKENIKTTNNSFQWVTDPEDYTWSFTGDFGIQSSGLSSQLDSIDGNSLLEQGKVARYIFSSRNLGLGLDLGATYQLNSKWDVGLSLVDLGYVRYSVDNRNYSGAGQDVAFAGIEITEAFISGDASFADSLDAAIADLGQALEESVDLQSSRDSYRSALRTRAYASVGYRIFRKKKSYAKAGLNLYTDMRSDEKANPRVTLNYAHTWSDRFTMALGYSLINVDRKNLGVAFSMKGGPGMFYVTLDNILWTNMSKFDIAGSETNSSFSYPSFSQNAALHFGMNIILKNRVKGAKAMPRMS